MKEQYADINTPFYYEAADSWKIALKYAEFYGIVIVLLIGYFAAGVFADEFRLQADSVFFSSRYGRTKAVRSKICTGVLMATVVYWGAMVLFSVITLTVMGVSGAGTPIQIEWKDSIYAITYVQAYFLVLVCGYIASLLSASITMLISAKTHSASIAMCIPFFLFCVSPFIARALGFETVSNVIPQRLFFVDNIIRAPIVFQVGDMVFRQIPFIMFLYTIISLATVPFIYRSYQRHVVR